jgi:hypothetical protein
MNKTLKEICIQLQLRKTATVQNTVKHNTKLISQFTLKNMCGAIQFKGNIKYWCFKTFRFHIFTSHSCPCYVSDNTAGLLSVLKQLSLWVKKGVVLLHLLISLRVKTIDEQEILTLESVLYALLFRRFFIESSHL